MKKNILSKIFMLFICLVIILTGILYNNRNPQRVFISSSDVYPTYAFYITPSYITIQYNMRFDIFEDKLDENYAIVNQGKLDNKPRYMHIKLSKQDRNEIFDMIKKIKKTDSFDTYEDMMVIPTEVPTCNVYADINNKCYASYAANSDTYNLPQYYNGNLIKLSNKLVLIAFDYLYGDKKVCNDNCNELYKQFADELSIR